MPEKDWKWDGSLWEFLEIVQWTLVTRQLGKDQPEGWSKMITNPQMIDMKAEEYGITLRAINDEMYRISQDGKRMFELLDMKAKAEDLPNED